MSRVMTTPHRHATSAPSTSGSVPATDQRSASLLRSSASKNRRFQMFSQTWLAICPNRKQNTMMVSPQARTAFFPVQNLRARAMNLPMMFRLGASSSGIGARLLG